MIKCLTNTTYVGFNPKTNEATETKLGFIGKFFRWLGFYQNTHLNRCVTKMHAAFIDGKFKNANTLLKVIDIAQRKGKFNPGFTYCTEGAPNNLQISQVTFLAAKTVCHLKRSEADELYIEVENANTADNIKPEVARIAKRLNIGCIAIYCKGYDAGKVVNSVEDKKAFESLCLFDKMKQNNPSEPEESKTPPNGTKTPPLNTSTPNGTGPNVASSSTQSPHLELTVGSRTIVIKRNSEDKLVVDLDELSQTVTNALFRMMREQNISNIYTYRLIGISSPVRGVNNNNMRMWGWHKAQGLLKSATHTIFYLSNSASRTNAFNINSLSQNVSLNPFEVVE